MKTLLAFVIAAFIYTSTYAQCENAYFPFEDGVTFELTSYKPNGKKTGKIVNQIKDTGESDKIIVSHALYDKKDKLLDERQYGVTCEDGTIKMDISGMIPQESMGNYKDMEMTVEGDFLEIPDDLEEGKILPDGKGIITMKMPQGGGIDMTMEITFTNRKVEKEEKITTPAGTFETFKIIQTTNVTSELMGMSKSAVSQSANWVAVGVGTVKSEQYDKKGEMESFSLLTNSTK